MDLRERFAGKSRDDLILELVGMENLFYAEHNKVEELRNKLCHFADFEFFLGQKIWDKMTRMYWDVVGVSIRETIDHGETLRVYTLGHIGTDDYQACIMPRDKDTFFHTKEEAEKAGAK